MRLCHFPSCCRSRDPLPHSHFLRSFRISWSRQHIDWSYWKVVDYDDYSRRSDNVAAEAHIWVVRARARLWKQLLAALYLCEHHPEEILHALVVGIGQNAADVCQVFIFAYQITVVSDFVSEWIEMRIKIWHTAGCRRLTIYKVKRYIQTVWAVCVFDISCHSKISICARFLLSGVWTTYFCVITSLSHSRPPQFFVCCGDFNYITPVMALSISPISFYNEPISKKQAAATWKIRWNVV